VVLITVVVTAAASNSICSLRLATPYALSALSGSHFSIVCQFTTFSQISHMQLLSFYSISSFKPCNTTLNYM